MAKRPPRYDRYAITRGERWVRLVPIRPHPRTKASRSERRYVQFHQLARTLAHIGEQCRHLRQHARREELRRRTLAGGERRIAAGFGGAHHAQPVPRSEEHTSELQSLMRISYAVFCLKKKTNTKTNQHHQSPN